VEGRLAYDAIIIGGGAAGLSCAAWIAQSGKKVAVLERTAKVGKKILMSGGGRCNFTNMYSEPENFLSANPHFCISALSRYTPWDFIALVDSYNIPYHEKKLGQLFCDNSAKDILSMLLSECDKSKVNIYMHCDIQQVVNNGHYKIHTNKGVFESEVVVVASGGLSIPSMGVTGFGYELAQQFGMEVIPSRAGLVPFTFTDNIKTVSNHLSGLSVDTIVSNHKSQFRENILFTHRGLSGPAILQISSYWQASESIDIDLLPEEHDLEWLYIKKKKQPKTLLRTLLAERLPKALVAELETLWWPQQSQTPMAEIPNTLLQTVMQNLKAWRLRPSGTEGYRTAEVTLGGVDTQEVSSKNMESKKQSGLFFVGEVVDVTGHLGGHNFQWAWASAYAAAQGIIL